MNEDRFSGTLYQKFPITIEKGNGINVVDTNGKKYIDCIGGYGVALIGHSNKRLLNSITEQLTKIITVHSSLYNKTREKFLENIVKISPKKLSNVYLSNSGSESVEAAIKFARKFSKKTGIISMTGAYHGKTIGALSITHSSKYRLSFKPLLKDVSFAKFNDIESLQSLINDNTGTIIIEPIQGENGIYLPNYKFLENVRKICDELNILLIFDEIQSGLGRTGKMWAAEHWNTIPDIMCLAKGIAGGLPMGATLVRQDILSCIKKGEHSSTFGGNPLSCAAGNAVIETIIEENLISNAQKEGELLLTGLKDLKMRHTIIREIRGKGLMIGIELKFDIKQIILDGIKHGLLLLYSGRNIIRLLPPLILNKDNVISILNILDILFAREEKRRNAQRQNR
ncbi:MAG: aspartate aminotransferase family protein [Thaumarchaeota archaeon]|nr:aspartate aminotransferase family protein [Nitrososphaerota archaeon]MCY3976015.1 aspartate aminotransferase family protein [Nitrososphaerota archaeon]